MKDWGASYPDLSTYETPAKERRRMKYSVPSKQWKGLSPGQKQEALLADALDYKRELLSLPRPSPDTIDAESTNFRRLLLQASDGVINQVLQIEANALHRPAASDIESVFQERIQKSLEEIKRIEEA